jgi:hypothetical protein
MSTKSLALMKSCAAFMASNSRYEVAPEELVPTELALSEYWDEYHNLMSYVMSCPFPVVGRSPDEVVTSEDGSYEYNDDDPLVLPLLSRLMGHYGCFQSNFATAYRLGDDFEVFLVWPSGAVLGFTDTDFRLFYTSDDGKEWTRIFGFNGGYSAGQFSVAAEFSL